MSSDVVETPAPAPAPAGRDRTVRRLGLLALAVIVIDILAVVFLPPFPLGGSQGQACAYPTCFINGTLELPPPHTVIDLDPAHPLATGSVVIGFHPSITSTILTMWIVMAVLLLLTFLATRGMQAGAQPAPEPDRVRLRVAGETSGSGMGGKPAKPYIPLFAAFFLLILFCNWSGLVPPVGKIEELRAPTSRRQHHDRPGPGQLRLLRVPGLPAARRPGLPRQVLPALRVPQRASAPGSSRCSSA